MKRLFSIFAALAMVAAIVACEQEPTPDGECAIKSISITKVLNSSISSDIPGTIDGNTITFVIPSDAIGESLIPTFMVTEFDVVKIGGVEVESGVTACNIADGVKIEVEDAVSALSASYTICVKENDGEAVLLSVAIVKDSDPSITEDIAAASIEPEMIVRVPGAAFQKELTIKATAGKNDIIKINGEIAADGQASVDTKFPIDIEVIDENAGAKQAYVVKVGKILDLVVTPVATAYSEGTLGSMNMAVNPVDNAPYIIYVRANEGDTKKGLSVAKFENGNFNLVGTGSVSENTTNDASAPVITFAADGTPYALYVGGEVSGPNTLKKWNGSAWELVGTAGIQGNKLTTTYGYPTPVFQPGENVPVVFACGGGSKSTPNYRNIEKSSWNGSSWTTAAPSEFPKYGTPSGTNGMYYASKVVYSGDKVYMVSAFNIYGFYVSECTNSGAYNHIVNNYLPEGESYGLPGNLGIDCDPDGNIFIFEALAKATKMQLYKVDKENNTVVEHGPGLPVGISSTGGTENAAAFAINPANGQIICAIEETTETSKTLVFKYLDDNLAWNDLSYTFPVGNEKAFIKEFAMDYANNGIAYVAVRIGNNKGGNGVEGIHLFSIGLEDDILPE